MNPFKCGAGPALGSAPKVENIGGKGISVYQQNLDQQSTANKILSHFKNLEESKRRTEITIKSYLKFKILYDEAMKLYAAKLALGNQEKTEKTDEELCIIIQKLAALIVKINELKLEYSAVVEAEEKTPPYPPPNPSI